MALVLSSRRRRRCLERRAKSVVDGGGWWSKCKSKKETKHARAQNEGKVHPVSMRRFRAGCHFIFSASSDDGETNAFHDNGEQRSSRPSPTAIEMIARTIKHFDDLFYIISNNFGEFWGAHLHVWSLKHFTGTRAEIHWLGRGRMPVLLRSVKHKNNSHACPVLQHFADPQWSLFSTLGESQGAI